MRLCTNGSSGIRPSSLSRRGNQVTLVADSTVRHRHRCQPRDRAMPPLGFFRHRSPYSCVIDAQQRTTNVHPTPTTNTFVLLDFLGANKGNKNLVLFWKIKKDEKTSRTVPFIFVFPAAVVVFFCIFSFIFVCVSFLHDVADDYNFLYSKFFPFLTDSRWGLGPDWGLPCRPES